MSKTKSSSKKSSGDTLSWESRYYRTPKKTQTKTQTKPLTTPIESDAGQVVDDTLLIAGAWGEPEYLDHPATTPISDFMQKLYESGFENDVRTERKNIATAIEEERGGADLKTLRLHKGLSQTELAEQAGVQQYRISRYESGMEKPNFLTMQRLCAVLEIDANTLFSAICNGEQQ